MVESNYIEINSFSSSSSEKWSFGLESKGRQWYTPWYFVSHVPISHFETWGMSRSGVPVPLSSGTPRDLGALADEGLSPFTP